MPKPFNERCYDLLRKVPRGRVTTYQELAHALGCRAYRAVGQAMHRNPYAPKVPCHRVVCSSGRLGGFAHGQKKKIALLRQEGVSIEKNQIVGFKEIFFGFKKSAR